MFIPVPDLIVGIMVVAVLAAIVWLRFINPLSEQAQMAQERERSLTIGESVAHMLDEATLLDRLYLLTRTLRRLGWQSVIVMLFKENLAISEPPAQSPAQLSARMAAWRMRWVSLQPETLERHRLGIAYFFPANESFDDNTWRPEDTLVVPLRLTDGETIALIELANPADGQRPTKATVRSLSILAALARAAVENSQLEESTKIATEALQEQVEELVMIERADRELSATLNFDNVMTLTMDWAIRRTGASAGMVHMVTPDGAALTLVALVGYPPDTAQHYTADTPLPISEGIIGRAARTRKIQIVADTSKDPDYVEALPSTRSQVAAPMEIRGHVIGVLSLETDQINGFDSSHISFIQRLASRAVIALDNARLYRETEGRADEMAALYSAGRAMSSSIERSQVLTNSAQSLAAVLNASSAILADYQAERNRLIVTVVYKLGTVQQSQEVLPAVGDVLDLSLLPDLRDAIRSHQALTVQDAEADMPDHLQGLIAQWNCYALLMAPLSVQNQIVGVAFALEGRHIRRFTEDDVLVAESVASQAALAMRQAMLYQDVRELENLKSEMIRMASHDLRGPLGNAMGFFDLLVSTFANSVSDAKRFNEYAAIIRESTNAMRTLIDDLLTLEKVESERQLSWSKVNLLELVQTVVDAQQSSAILKQQTLTLDIIPPEADKWRVFGSSTQLRQAVTNFVSNAIKYTPDEGRIQVRLTQEASRLIFEVEDNGYGISPERQSRLFQRFYRAREVGTEHIPGTGLGLSLVKTVIERHAGEVWVRSEPGKGSTFAFSLPTADGFKLMAREVSTSVENPSGAH